ncbi:hypothetical protein DRO54_09810 [Candidatus Bathyarchaeota archaeon]|nr:MAG: hypothetical protein DRO54_09810 [Candidatus Bathyarchaeota archaeon]
MIKAVILAAGKGKRISKYMNDKPKPLIPIFGKPLIEYPLEALSKNDVEECIIVVGYKAEAIRNYLGEEKYTLKFRYVYNPAYENGNGISLYTAKEIFEDSEPFLVLMADHLIDPKIVEKALKHIDKNPLLCVDYSPKYNSQLKDATKVLVNEKGFIQNIGKNLTKWNAVDTGVFILNAKIFESIEKVKENPPVTVSKCLRQMIHDGTWLWACDASGLFWLDIDLPEDLEFAEKILAEMTTVA